MSRMGYSWERAVEVWACKLLDQDLKSDFIVRSYRTATSGTHDDSDVRIQSRELPFNIAVECKHRKYTSNGDYAFKFEESFWVGIKREAEHFEKATGKLTFPTLAFSLKGAAKDKNWFIFDEKGAIYLFGEFPFVNLSVISKPNKHYVILSRKSLLDSTIEFKTFMAFGTAFTVVSQNIVADELTKRRMRFQLGLK